MAFIDLDELTEDFSRGVLERFTRRAPVDWIVPIPNRTIPGGNAQVKTVADPRKIYFFSGAHFPIYFEGNYSVNVDDGILKYRAARAKKFSLENEEQKFCRMKEVLVKIFSAENFSLETALTCRVASNLLQEKFLEEASLGAILKSLDRLKLSDVRLFLGELPNLLCLPHPVVKELRGAAIQIISQTMNFMRENEFWKDFSDLENLRRLLKIFGK